jgi:glycosyltransferase involved in cell wall biosynthesis
VHVHFFYPTILLAALYKKFINPTVKIIATFHGSDIYLYTPFTKRYEDMMAILDTAIYVSSDLAARHQMFGLEKMVIPAGIKNEFQAFTETEKKYDFIFIGNLELIKGADRLLSMIDKMPKRQFLVVGNGEYSDKLKRANYEHVEYLAHATPSTLCKLINQSYCLINLSRSESFGLVMTEALACHTPVIATQTDGSKEQLADLQCAQIIPQEYTHELIESEYIKLRSKKLSWDDTDKHIRKYKLEHIANQLEQLYLS